MHPLSLLFISLAATLLLGVPIAFALLLSSLLVIYVADLPSVVMIQQMFNGINTFTLLALPFFFLAGNVMSDGGISERLVKLAMALVGHLRGGLAHVNVVVGMFISGISGSSTADAAAIGAVFFPAMKRRGYDEKFSVCLTACTSTMGVVIPPSILMVIYGATAGVSTGALLLGGILPGVLMGLALMVQSHFFAVKYNFPREHPRFLGIRAVGQGLKEAAWPMGVPVIIVAGMVGGVFTPTESAAVAAVYALFVTLFILRTLRWGALPKLFGETTIQFSQILFCVGGAMIFGWILAYYQVPDMVSDFILGFTRDKLVVMLLIVIPLFSGFDKFRKWSTTRKVVALALGAGVAIVAYAQYRHLIFLHKSDLPDALGNLGHAPWYARPVHVMPFEWLGSVIAGSLLLGMSLHAGRKRQWPSCAGFAGLFAGLVAASLALKLQLWR